MKNKDFEFLSLIGGLKQLERFKGQFFWRDYPEPPRWDSVAEHSWRLAVSVMLLGPKLKNKIDVLHAMEIALVHDIPEIAAGDESPLGEDGTGKNTHAFNEKKKQIKHQNEKKAAKKVFGTLGPDGKRFCNLWLEFEEQKTQEAKIVKALDHVEAGIQYFEYRKGHVFPDHRKFSYVYNAKGTDVDPIIFKLAKFVVNLSDKKYKEFKK